MSKFEYGFNRAVKEIIGGLVSSVFVEAFVSSGLIPPIIYAIVPSFKCIRYSFSNSCYTFLGNSLHSRVVIWFVGYV